MSRDLLLDQRTERLTVRLAPAVRSLSAFSANNLSEVVLFLRTRLSPTRIDPSKSDDDFSEVHGQQHVKRAVEVAAAGAHNILMIGPIFDAKGSADLALRKEKQAMDETFFGIYGFYCDSDSRIR